MTQVFLQPQAFLLNYRHGALLLLLGHETRLQQRFQWKLELGHRLSVNEVGVGVHGVTNRQQQNQGNSNCMTCIMTCAMTAVTPRRLVRWRGLHGDRDAAAPLPPAPAASARRADTPLCP